jgi:CRISPR-associated protein Cas1
MAIAANVLDKNEGPYIKQFREKLSGYLLKINTATTEDALDLANKLRGWEANASKLYFRCLSYSLPQEFRFSKRSKRPARDPFNATLNYCYGILYNKIEGMMIRAGLDLHIGVFHKDQHNRPVLVFDFIEQYRHWSEYPVIEMFQNKLLSLDHFSEDETTGVSILQPGKKIIIETYFSYMHEKIDYNNSRGKRFWHIQNAIQQFSTKMKEYKPNDIKQSGI